MKRIAAGLVVLSALVVASSAAAAGWGTVVPFTNKVATSPTTGGGYPNFDGSSAPIPGTCRAGKYNSNHSESWIAVQPGTENLIGVSKLFFENFSTFYNFHLGSVSIPNGSPAGTVQIPGYDCVSTGTQDMPPSWTNDTDPNVDFDTQGRAYQVTLPFNAYWTNLHPNGAIGAVYTDDLGKTWSQSKGADKFGYLEFLSNQSSFAFGGFEDKQWIAVNRSLRYTDHVYAMWAVFNGDAVKIHESVSRDRGKTYSTPITITAPSQTGPATTYIYPSVDARGDLYVALAAFDASGGADADIYVAKSTDDGKTFTNWTFVGRATGNPDDFVNGDFRDGILENFAASPSYAGHAYVTYEQWNSATGTMDIKFSYTTDGGSHWSTPTFANDASTVNDATDQLQPSVAAGPNGAVVVGFYDRRAACGADRSIAQTGKANACMDVSVQAYKDNGTTVTAVGSNAKITQYQWDPSQPLQKVGGLGQQACASHTDPCSSVFIGDYFGLAVSQANIYGFFVSTHYPSNVKADGGGPVFYQQQVLATVPRSGIAAGY